MSAINSFLEQKISVKNIIIILGVLGVVAIVIIGILFYTFGGMKEGFQASWRGVGAALNYSIGDGVKTSWENKNIEEIAREEKEKEDNGLILEQEDIYSNLESNVGGPIPLKEGELLVFEQNKFSPDCCPSDYSNSSGCVCASPEQAKYLNERGGNRTQVDMF
jgi:hypothetical protein